MFAKRAATIQRNADAEAERRHLQATDPYELAKHYLQCRGYRVYSEAVEKPKSKLIVVGSMRLTREAVVELAGRMRERGK